MDANSRLAGDDYEQLPETYVIFITENDVLHGNLPIYHIERTIQEKVVDVDDGLHIIYVNNAITDDTPLGRLMHDFRCTKPEDMHYKELADRVRYLKESPEGVSNMCKAMEEMRNEAEARGEAKGKVVGKIEGKIEVAMEMLKENLSIDKIAKITKLSTDKITELGRLNGLL